MYIFIILSGELLIIYGRKEITLLHSLLNKKINKIK